MPSTVNVDYSRKSRTGKRTKPRTKPERFADYRAAREHIGKNELRITTHESHSRGQRIHVVTPEGKALTLRVTKPQEEK